VLARVSIRLEYMKLDILGQKMIAFDHPEAWGAYVRGTPHISSFESSWTSPGPGPWSIRKINIPSKTAMASYMDRRTHSRILNGSL
jgi:hypothetical protein